MALQDAGFELTDIWYSQQFVSTLKRIHMEDLTPYGFLEVPWVLCANCGCRKWLEYLAMADPYYWKCNDRDPITYDKCECLTFRVGNLYLVRSDIKRLGII